MQWFNEGEPMMAKQYRERPRHPLPAAYRYLSKKVKLMCLQSTSEDTPIGLWEMAKEYMTKFKTKGSTKAKGITGVCCERFLKKIKATCAAGPRPHWDLAGQLRALLESQFGEAVFQPPSSPDLNHCDAG